jgi:hypothetical protein
VAVNFKGSSRCIKGEVESQLSNPKLEVDICTIVVAIVMMMFDDAIL